MSTDMLTLYPPIEPNRTHRLQVDPLHSLHVEQSGNPSGIPVLFLHGGPGAGSTEKHRRYFDPARYHIINFDQRGCNRSSPRGETARNTTSDLLSDIEQIRRQLGIHQWVIFGGSWGATLGLLYAQHYPERILGLVLRGIFLARQADRDWFFQDGAGRILPEAWEQFRDFIVPERQSDLVGAYYDCIRDHDTARRDEAAARWAAWTGSVVSWTLEAGIFDFAADIERVVNEVMIETHYAKHDYFIAENEILAQTARLPRVPVMIIHGRRDLTCTPDASWLLHSKLPDSELRLVHEGGHLTSEPVMIDALINATDRLAARLTA